MDRGRILLSLAVTSLLLSCACAVPASETPSRATRLMVVGDSISQGNPGDWTWRYRLDKHLEAMKSDVDFVGPRDDLGTALGDHLDYLDPDFDRDHAALGGMGFSTLQPSATDLVQSYRPDVILLLMGINDLVFFGKSPEAVRAYIARFVADARAVDDSVDFVIGRLTPARVVVDVPKMDHLIDTLCKQMDTPRSRVVEAKPDVGFSISSDTYDGVHPSAQGEVKIAAAFADGLAALHVGRRSPRPLPRVPNGPREAPVVVGEPRDGSVVLSWSGSPGADHEYVWLRRSDGGAWTRLPQAFAGTGTTLGGLDNGVTYEIELQPVKGSHAAADDVRSNRIHFTPSQG